MLTTREFELSITPTAISHTLTSELISQTTNAITETSSLMGLSSLTAAESLPAAVTQTSSTDMFATVAFRISSVSTPEIVSSNIPSSTKFSTNNHAFTTAMPTKIAFSLSSRPVLTSGKLTPMLTSMWSIQPSTTTAVTSVTQEGTK